MPNAPKLYIVQWTDTKGNVQVSAFATKALALAYITDESLISNTPYDKGVFIYKVGTSAAIKEYTGTWD